MTYPKCPHCKHQFNDEEIWHTGSTIFPTGEDGDEEETECSNCKKPLFIRLELCPSWTFLDEDGDELLQ